MSRRVEISKSGRVIGLVLVAVLALSGCGQQATQPAAGPVAAAPPPPPPPVADGEDTVNVASVVADVATNSDATEPGNSVATEQPSGGSSAADDQAVAAPPPPDVHQVAAQAPAGNVPNPFPRRQPAPEFPQDYPWFNSKPLSKADLKGKFVLLDFWTYCCINCMHILPELKKLEEEYPNNLVVIGVHSAKFEAEKEDENIRSAILRYEIVHPVINDAKHELWWKYGVQSWPTIWLIDPEGMAVRYHSGEFKAAAVSAEIQMALPYYREQKLLDETPLKFALEAAKQPPTPLRYPGKILADEKGDRLFISDSNHNRIVVSTLDGKLLDIIGSGDIGKGDGDFRTATFNHPQGCALAGEVLYVADNENHMLRKVDLKAKTVKTIAGTGEQASSPFPGYVPGTPVVIGAPRRYVGPPATTELSSPWALWVHKTDLFIAMAGTHQIWKMTLDEKEIGPYAGNAREDIVDGPLVPKAPFQGGSSFAQPSGLSSDGTTWLFVADSEGSSVRKVPLKPGTHEVDTVVGSAHLSSNRLFAFGDVDGPKNAAKLQHCLDVDFLDGKIYVADTYNHKIKVVNARTGETKTFAGTGKPGSGDNPADFHEPAGLTHAKGKLYVADTNNHLIRTIDVASGSVSTLKISGLDPPAREVAAGN